MRPAGRALSSTGGARILDDVQDEARAETMTRRDRGVSRARGVVLTLLLVGTATTSWAHEGRHAPAPVVEPAPVSALDSGAAGLLALVGLAGVIALAARRPRRPILALGVAVPLLVLGVEARLHAVHHLGDPARAAECTVAVATAHLTGSPADAVTADVVAAPALYLVLPGLPAPIPQRPPATHEGRAPPAPIV